MNLNDAMSRRGALKLGGTLLAGATLPGCVSALAQPTTTVGDPTQPAALPSAIIEAYNRGARDITIKPGVYILPATGKNSIELTGWKNAAIHCNGVTIIFKETHYRPVMLNQCSAITIENATLQFAGLSYSQGRIKEIGRDDGGSYVDWQIDAGYPPGVPARNMYNVIDQHTRLLKVGTGDCGAGKGTPLSSSGRFRLHQMNALYGKASIGDWFSVGDWLVCRCAAGGESIIQLNNSQGCTLRRITLKNSGFAAFHETGGEGGHHYVDCSVTRGPKPDGATEEQLIACGADGFHSSGTRVGPTIEHCLWDGVLLDDCIAIHGRFQTVIRSEGNRLILEARNSGGFAVNEPVRISSQNGFFAQARCVALRMLDAPDRHLELTLDQSVPVPAGAKAGNPERCGKSYKIINCTLGNTRSRGILVKADTGLIRGCVIEGCGMSAVSIGPEYSWNEANYSWNVTVADNHFRHNSLRNNLNADGVIFVHGDGAMGNRNIDITNNKFEENYCPYMMSIAWTDGVNITNNSIKSPSPLPLSDSGYIIGLHDVRHVTLKGNTYSNPGPSVVRAVKIGHNTEGVTGHDDSGIRLIK